MLLISFSMSINTVLRYLSAVEFSSDFFFPVFLSLVLKNEELGLSLL